MEIKDPKLKEQVNEWKEQHKRGVNSIERRYVCEEVRADFNSGNPLIVGYAAVFNQRTQLWRGLFEQVAPGAFAKSIEKDDVRGLINHDPNLLLARTKAGTMTLSEDAHGLKYEIIPPDTSYAKDLTVSLKRKDITQSSFGFNIVKYEEARDEKTGDVTITLQEVKLFDVSPVTFPAYPGTEAHVRMIAGENEIAYLFEDSGQVIVRATKEPPPVEEPPAISDADLFGQFDEVIRNTFKR
jgi:uncharacterized protein